MGRDAVSKVISDNIARVMKARDVSARQITDRTGLGRTIVYDILAGRSQSPRVTTVAQIAEALKVPLSDLFLSEEQLEAQTQLLHSFQMLQPDDQERLAAIARALLPSA